MEEKKITVLLHEHAQINKKIDDFIGTQFTYITTLLTMSGAFIYFTLNLNNNSEIINVNKFLPYLILILGPTFLFKFNRAIYLHGYRSYLEVKINDLLGENLIFGGQLVKEKLLEKNPFARLNYIFFLLLFIITIFICNWFNPDIITSKNEGISFFKYPDIHFYLQISTITLLILFFYSKNKKAFSEGFNFHNSI